MLLLTSHVLMRPRRQLRCAKRTDVWPGLRAGKPVPKTFAVCTIRSTPSTAHHCIAWAKSYLFPCVIVYLLLVAC